MIENLDSMIDYLSGLKDSGKRVEIYFNNGDTRVGEVLRVEKGFLVLGSGDKETCIPNLSSIEVVDVSAVKPPATVEETMKLFFMRLYDNLGYEPSRALEEMKKCSDEVWKEYKGLS